MSPRFIHLLSPDKPPQTPSTSFLRCADVSASVSAGEKQKRGLEIARRVCRGEKSRGERRGRPSTALNRVSEVIVPSSTVPERPNTC